MGADVARENPHLSAIPMRLPDRTIAALNGPRIERFGYSFQVPWEDVEENGRSLSLVQFKRGVRLFLFNPSNVADIPKVMNEVSSEKMAALKRFYGTESVKSGYNFMTAELAATPAKMKWWAAPSDNIRNSIFLTMKSMDVRDSDIIYQLSFDKLRGFQFGNPEVAPYRVELDLFDENNQHYRIMLFGSNDSRRDQFDCGFNAADCPQVVLRAKHTTDQHCIGDIP